MFMRQPKLTEAQITALEAQKAALKAQKSALELFQEAALEGALAAQKAALEAESRQTRQSLTASSSNVYVSPVSASADLLAKDRAHEGRNKHRGSKLDEPSRKKPKTR